ncbi:MinD/ParA family protein [Alkaliphilus peptidifermentans]|uniref:Flagellar biosynthesis protein FlhG n=1 Tax=Alkaliphilus peptidifermentans DSM 18978 TaxID=1120976 RepID=A0A1G5DGQ0_9FIRM|nr:MinD/ParA family protein [Alkaliphilus peptidifermentans]SCY13540.1 flagellar biosynthesis protein FlhG [Alkaliphilus peptidifermentans DSM 18978]
MKDQAARLRELIYQNKSKPIIEKEAEKQAEKQARIICITSGKGGVGKTNFTLNLAIALSMQNKKVVIFDADLGLANIDVVLGAVPKYTLADVVNGKKELMDVMIPGPNGIKIISGGSGITALIDLTQEKLQYLIEKFQGINDYADIILIDTGAGLSTSVLSFALAAEEVVVVCTPEPTAITDAYAMIKTIGKREEGKKLKLLINRVESVNEGKVAFEKLKNACEKFLNVQIEKLGFLADDIVVSRAVKMQKPFILQYPNSLVSKNVEVIALKLINEYVKEEVSFTTKGFFHKVISLFR